MGTGRGISGWCEHWLPILMGCHCRADRSFVYRGRPFPVCARCTGMLAGFALALVTLPFFHLPPLWLLLMMVPGILDGAIQQHSAYTSNNFRRLWTGILMGYGLLSLLVWSIAATVRLGWETGQRMKAEWRG